MRETLEKILALDPESKIETWIFDEYGDSKTEVNVGYFNKLLPRGIGLNWRGMDHLEFVNPQGFEHSKGLDEFRELVIVTYQAIAVDKALNELGYNVHTPEMLGPKLRLSAVAGSV